MTSRGSTAASFVTFSVVALATATACGSTVSGTPTAADAAAASSAPVTTTATTTTTTTTKTPTALPEVDAADFAGVQPGVYYFLSQSGKFECAVLVHTDAVAGCQGEMPANAPRVPGSGAPDVMIPANVVMVEAAGAAEFVNIGDIAFMDPNRGARTLPYGRALEVGPFTCSIDESSGVTCETGEHGFTVSDRAYDLW
ncbi:hypothetical protein [Rhodococcus chondri]|uniref:Lipoprotein n=1 Tax=Rhodococcus chondri TaxID=3065941 RepID=A0ABU7JWY9_9NOCA|nr:hypothetical protein [Rhodococcus sp. CC-R104]MEE2034543.1 hypothetical protein [Rhodococcus sp. CC-R104]